MNFLSMTMDASFTHASPLIFELPNYLLILGLNMCGISVIEVKCMVLVLERLNMCGANVIDLRYVWC